MKACKLFIFRYQVSLMLRSSGRKELIEHPKDRGKDDLNLMASSFQPKKTDPREN